MSDSPVSKSPIVFYPVEVAEAFQCLEPIAHQLKEGKTVQDIDFGRNISMIEKIRILHAVERVFEMAHLLQNGSSVVEIPEWMLTGRIQ